MFEPRRTMFFFIFTKNHIVFVSVILHPNRLKLHMKLRFIVLMLRADVAQNGKKMRALRALIFFRIFYLTSSVLESRNFQRFGASLSSELYNANFNYSIGPFEDGLFFYKSCQILQLPYPN